MSTSASLNTAYRLVRRADAQWVPVPETATGHGAARAGAQLVAHLLLAALPLVANAGPPGAGTLPTGGTLAAGQASWQTQGSTLTVNQASQRAVIDWQRFDLGSQASVVFNQAAGRNAATLNRVLGNQPSQILGRIQAPGQVFISNPSGVIFGSSARVDVGGLVATTMSTSNADFMAGNGLWQRQGSTGAVVNQGTLTAADGGYVALLAPEVRNEGVVLARAGTVALAAGESVRLDFDGPGLASVLVTPAALKTLVDNRQALLAPEGVVILSARSAESLRSGVVNQAGLIDASSLVSRGGRVLLEGDNLTLAAGSRIDATGATGGGTVHVGGGWQGSGPLAGATTVVMAEGASIDASATRRGDGGEVVLWSDVARNGTRTAVQGRISARAGAEGGDGGRVETSGHTLDIRGATVDASSAKGRGGRWLLDPTDLTIDAAQAATIVTALEGGTDTTVQTVAGGSDAGHLTVGSGIRWSSSADLTLQADGDIFVRAPILAEHANAVLTFQYGQGAVAAGNTADYHVLAPIGLNGGPNFVTQRGSDGSVITHTVINAVGTENDSGGQTLQGMRGNLAGHYVLGASLNIGHVSGWNSGAGFTPVGDNSTPFTGSFDGLGNTLIGLTINRPSAEYQGLFGKTQDASIRNLGLADVSITASARGGALAGVVGANTQVSTVYATGTVAGGSMLGGLAGSLSSGVVVSDSYLSVNVGASGGWAGGLTGDQSGATVQRVFSTGSVSGSFNAGGLLGGKNGTVTNSFTTGSLYGYNFGGSETNSGTRSASQLKQASTFASYDLANVWTIYEGRTTPLLNAFLTPVTVTAAAQKTYDGTLDAVLADATLSSEGLRNQLQGTLVYGGGANSANAGSYASTTASGLYSGQQGVRISYAPVGTLTIDPKALTVVGAAAANKVYDRSTDATVSGTLQGVVGSDAVSLQASASFADKNVGTAKPVTATFTLDGAAAGNYTVAQPTGLTADITPAQLTVSGVTAANKVYDRETVASVSGGTLSGVLGGDTVTLAAGSGSFADKNVGTGKAVTAGFSLAGADAANYVVAPVTGLTADITPATVALASTSVGSKVYDGQTAATLSGGALTGVLGSDAVTLQASQVSFLDANVGTAKPVTAQLSLAGADAGNYVLAAGAADALTGDITRLGSVSWVGGSRGSWFDASNWAGGAVPIRDNVANVVIPQGTLVTVADGAAADAPMLASLTGAGSVSVARQALSASGAISLASLAVGAGGELAAGSLTVPSLTQTGGRISVNGALTVNGQFAQVDGQLRAGGAASVTQAAGDLSVRHLVAGSLVLRANDGALTLGNVGSVADARLHAAADITQTDGGSLTVLGALDATAGGDVRLAQARNMVVGTVAVQGRHVQLVQAIDDLVLGNVVASGDLAATAATGHLRQATDTTLSVTGSTTAVASQGSVYLMNESNRLVGTVSARGQDVGLTQGAAPLVLGTVTAGANLAVKSGGTVTQVGALTVGERTSLDAVGQDVRLDRRDNDFTGAVTARTGALTLVDGSGGLQLGGVQTSGATLVESYGGPISQTSSFATTSGLLSVFNAWQDGSYTSVSLNTEAAVQINGQVASTAGAGVSAGIARALSALSWSALPTSLAAAQDTARPADQKLTLPATVPVKAE